MTWKPAHWPNCRMPRLRLTIHRLPHRTFQSLELINPLGLSQTNFDLMDEVFPGLNNIATHIRPFTLVTWAWKRAAACAERLGTESVAPKLLQDFVDRIEVVYVWSQLLRPTRVELPG